MDGGVSGNGGLLLTSFRVDSGGDAASLGGGAASTLGAEKEGRSREAPGDGGRRDGPPALPEEASCRITAVPRERRPRRSKVRFGHLRASIGQRSRSGPTGATPQETASAAPSASRSRRTAAG